jgi:translation initiation factor IF-1
MDSAHKDRIVKEGQVIEALPAANFRIALDDGSVAIGHLSGKMRMYYIKVLVGDRVQMEFSPHDEKKGRITRRF